MNPSDQPQAGSQEEIANAREAVLEERASSYLYRIVEEVEGGAYAQMFERLRAASNKQAEIWEAQLRRAGVDPPEFRPGVRHRFVAALLRRLGVRRTLPVLAAMKVRGLAVHRDGQLAADARAQTGGGDAESWHRASRSGGALRAAVFGVNDGLVSNAGLILGVAGAGANNESILIAGVAGLLAGGFSMAAGEYISVRTQRELFEYQIAIERHEIRTMPQEEIAELAVIYEAKGLAAADARAIAEQLLADPERGLDTLAREELGLDPQGLGSPWAAATSSFVSFAAGAFIPLLPYFSNSGPTALAGTVVAMELGLLAVGGLMSLFTGRNAAWSALRMALIGSGAAAVTYGIGRLFGIALG
jgi:VIT1/CCC1 family predicted Fe2+/Mn2+ transporter